MDNYNKKDLLHTIDKQKDEISKYKIRLRDVITAYKGLLNEKEAVEASFKAISGSNGNTSGSSPFVRASSEGRTSDSDSASEVDVGRAQEDMKKQETETAEGLRSQLSTLMNSLATLSAEKSRMEASFQADKKQLRIEKEEREKKVRDLHDRLQNMTKQRITDVESMKSKLIVERHEREREQNDHGVMIRELQKLLSEERRSKEQLQKQVDDMRSKLSTFDGQSGQNEQYERKLRDVRNELESTRRKLNRAESKANETPPLLIELQNEMSHMRAQHLAAIREEQKRAADAEDRARRLAANHEERVANLEGRLAELSNTVGSYDRVRQLDQHSINKLKEHIAQLDLEQNIQPRGNSQASESSVSSNEELKGKSEVDLNNDVQELLSKIIHLKIQLISANQRSEKPIDIAAALTLDEDIHRNCQEEYQQLEHKFELYKLKSSSVGLQSNNSRKMVDEAPILEKQIQVLKEKTHILHAQLEDTERECKQKLDDSANLVKSERKKHKEQVVVLESDYKRQILSLEQELKKQRERSMAMLEEKDEEIITLKSTFQMFIPGHKNRKSSVSSTDHVASGLSDEVLSSFTQLGSVLSGGRPMSAGQSPHMLHYAHELSRRDVEISALRKSKYSLECTFRELQRETSREEEKYKVRIKSLQDEVGRFERCQSRESANLEYLKNVVLSFLLSKDSNSKQHMLNAIAAVLKFSTDELDKVNQISVNASGT